MTSEGDFIIIGVIKKDNGVITEFWSHNLRGTDRLGQLDLVLGE